MSAEQARLFFERMKSDAAFRERVMAIVDVAERLVFIQSAGFQCTEKDIKEVSCELSEKDLDAAAGGIFLTVNISYN
jgi:predicted ribosomally synthesized peptide with nif11-like leader